MLLNIKLFFSILIIGLLIDILWIGIIAKNFYLTQFGSLARLKPDGTFDIVLWAGLVVYIFITLGLVFFVLPKVAPTDSYFVALGWGFLFGLILYGVYDYTNYSTLAKWPLVLCFVDVAWGAVLCGILSVIGKYLRSIF